LAEVNRGRASAAADEGMVMIMHISPERAVLA
jgi:hypothetical protein